MRIFTTKIFENLGNILKVQIIRVQPQRFGAWGRNLTFLKGSLRDSGLRVNI